MAAVLIAALLWIHVPRTVGAAESGPDRVVAVVALDAGLTPEESMKAWLPHRLAALVRRSLRRLGLRSYGATYAGKGPWNRKGLAALDIDAVVAGTARPAAPTSGTETITVNLVLTVAKGRASVRRLSGPADRLEQMAARIAVNAARALSVKIPEDALVRLSRAEQPFLVQRYLGEAELNLSRNDFRRALFKFDRAADLRKQGFVVDAMEGARWARRALRTASTDDEPLAASSLEKADVKRRQGKKAEELAGLRTFLRYTQDRSRLWQLTVPVDAGEYAFAQSNDRWWLQPGTRLANLVELNPSTGGILGMHPAVDGLAGAIGTHVLALSGKSLSRLRPGHEPQWTRTLPFAPRLGAHPHIDVAGGMAAIAGDGRLAWIDLGLGTLGQVATGVRVLGTSVEGALVMSRDRKNVEGVAFLRPGRSTPAWRMATAVAPSGAAVTRGRTLVLSQDKLTILDVRNGKPRAAPITIPSKSRLIAADGRYAAFGGADNGVVVHDIVTGERTAKIVGPAAAVSALSTSTGIAVLYRSGDLIAYDRDGKYLDRALVEGQPLGLVRGSALTPGPVAITERGVFAFGDTVERSRTRDVDALVRVVRLLESLGDVNAALRVAEQGAMHSAGCIAQFESVRARLLAKTRPAAAAIAARRADIARDPTRPLPAFRAM